MVIYNKAVRDKLCDLSFRIWGARNRWQKVMKKKDFQVPVGKREDKKPLIRLKNGQTISLHKAQSRGLLPNITPDQIKNLQTKTVYREPNADELTYMMTCMLDEKVAKNLDAQALSIGEANVENYFLARVFQTLNGDLHYPWDRFVLTQKEGEEEKINELLEELPAKSQELLKVRLLSVDNSKGENAIREGIDAVLFLELCIESGEDLDKLEKDYNDFMHDMREKVSYK